MHYFVYVLKSRSHTRTYTGLTSDLERRLQEHNSGKTKSTRPYSPWEFIYTEKHLDRATARKREKYLKTGSGRVQLKKILDGLHH